MNEEEPAPAPAPEAAAPETQTDHAAELAALKEELAAIRELITARPAERRAASVPATDTPPPAITPKAPDTSALPVYARLAAGYVKNA